MFDDSDPALIASALLLFPHAGERDRLVPIAREYAAHTDKRVQKNAEYALGYLER